MLDIVLEMAAIPCPRPRVWNNRATYPSSYTKFKQECSLAIQKALASQGFLTSIENHVECKIELFMVKPKTGKLKYPRADVDNYAKSVLDSLTASGVWADDSLVAKLTVSKQYHTKNLIKIKIKETIS